MLEIRTPGGLAIKQDGEPVAAFESDKVRALLVYLAVESKRAHHCETLVGLLWPKRTERGLNSALKHRPWIDRRFSQQDEFVECPFGGGHHKPPTLSEMEGAGWKD